MIADSIQGIRTEAAADMAELLRVWDVDTALAIMASPSAASPEQSVKWKREADAVANGTGGEEGERDGEKEKEGKE